MSTSKPPPTAPARTAYKCELESELEAVLLAIALGVLVDDITSLDDMPGEVEGSPGEGSGVDSEIEDIVVEGTTIGSVRTVVSETVTLIEGASMVKV